jgi:hypothetical protein
MATLSIKSRSSDRELFFLNPRQDYFTVELRGSSVRATRDVYAYTDASGLAKLFSKLAASKRPWVGAERWEALEGEFSISAQCSTLGQVSFSVLIRDHLGGPEEWSVSAVLETELGGLPGIAADAQLFFSHVAKA